MTRLSIRAVASLYFVLLAICPSTRVFSEEQPAEPPKRATTFYLHPVTPLEGFDLKDYMAKTSESLRGIWGPKMRLAVRPDKRGIVLISFTIRKSGELEGDSATLEKGSGDALMDEASLATVNVAAPFDPLPPNFHPPELKLLILFRYGLLADASYKPLYESANKVIQNGDFGSGAQMLESLLAQDPDYTNGWNQLGWLYNKLRRYDKAIAALNKAIELDPLDAFAYNNLGQSFAGQKKYERAVPQYQKQIEINARDQWAHGNLGRVYIELHQYDKAIAELELANSIAPKDCCVKYNLGRAYAKNGNPEKALAAFQNSVSDAPIPTRWNSVSYQMAEEKIDLPVAQHYAELAIAGSVLRLREISLENLTDDDLRQSNLLGYIWDTMGWIRFQQGNLGEAEKYIYSAWRFHSAGIVGDHLGQIYEKQGKRDEAIRTYALALAASQPPPETRGRLAALLGSEETIDNLVEQSRFHLADLRTIPLANSQNAEGIAEFWLIVSPGSVIRGVKFITGDEVLRPFTKDIQDAQLQDIFPEATETRLLRKARLSCAGASSPCNLVLASAEAARFIE